MKLSDGQSQATQPRRTSDSQKKPVKAALSDDSETEPEDDEQDLILNQKPGTSKLPTPARSPTPDPGRAPGRIIGSAYPLEDFKKNTATGDLVSKAVEDLGFVITDIITKPFSSKRTDEMIECMKEMRKVCLEVR